MANRHLGGQGSVAPVGHIRPEPSKFLHSEQPFGVRSDFAAVLRALISSQAGLTIVLAALAPYTLLWYASSANYSSALLFNGLMFAVASLAGQVLLRAWYRPLLGSDPNTAGCWHLVGRLRLRGRANGLDFEALCRRCELAYPVLP